MKPQEAASFITAVALALNPESVFEDQEPDPKALIAAIIQLREAKAKWESGPITCAFCGHETYGTQEEKVAGIRKHLLEECTKHPLSICLSMAEEMQTNNEMMQAHIITLEAENENLREACLSAMDEFVWLQDYVEGSTERSLFDKLAAAVTRKETSSNG